MSRREKSLDKHWQLSLSGSWILADIGLYATARKVQWILHSTLKYSSETGKSGQLCLLLQSGSEEERVGSGDHSTLPSKLCSSQPERLLFNTSHICTTRQNWDSGAFNVCCLKRLKQLLPMFTAFRLILQKSSLTLVLSNFMS